MLSRKSISLIICISDRFKNLCCLEGMCKLDGKCLPLVEEGKKVRQVGGDGNNVNSGGDGSALMEEGKGSDVRDGGNFGRV